MKLLKSITLAAAAFLLISCGSTKVEAPKLNKVYVTNTTPVQILPVTAITEELDLLQYFEGKFGEQTFSALLNMQADSKGITVLMLNDMMIEIGSIVYDGLSCTLDSSFFPKNLKGEYIILDLQNAYADFNQLKDHYAKYKLSFEETDECINEHAARVRSLYKKGELIERVIFQDGDITIENRLRGYSYYLSLAQ